MDHAGQASTDGSPPTPDALKEFLIMNTTFRFALRQAVYPVIAALSLGAAFAAHAAGEITADDTATQAWSVTKTRDQVKSELVAARAQGLLKSYGEIEAVTPAPKSRLTREEVRAQMTVERANSNLNWMYGEDSGSAVFTQQWTTRPAASHTVANSGK
jgi:hypothetical protein